MLLKNYRSQIFTFQTRPTLEEPGEQLLSCYADLMSTLERKLFSDFAKGKELHEIKSEYLKLYGITARQFNAIRVGLEGKIASIKELRKKHIEYLKRRIASLEKTIKTLKKKDSLALHNKKRRLVRLTSRLISLESDHECGKVRLCFGSKKLFRAQFDLAANGYTSHQEWKEEWQNERAKSFFLLGSKDETSGNQSCTATLEKEGTVALRIRLPNALSSHGKYLHIKNLYFSHGHETIVACLHLCQEAKTNDAISGVAISYRFLRDQKGWRVFVSLPVLEVTKVTQKRLGVIGVDVNVNHLAVVETDRSGNPIKHVRLNLTTYGKTQNQTKALVGDAVKKLVDWSVQTQKPLVIEALSFDKKKSELRETGNAKYARMLSSFAYNAIATTVHSRAFRFGVSVHKVNPAYTSIIGRVKFSTRYGLSVHESAALCIGRRLLGVSERLPRRIPKVYDGKSGHVALSLPARNRDKHVWSSWRQVHKKFPAVLAAHSRALKSDPQVGFVLPAVIPKGPLICR